MLRNTFLAAVLGICLICPGCDESGGQPPPPPPRRGGGSSGSGPAPSVSRGGVIFQAPDSNGKTVNVQSPAALFFYTSWCGYCKRVLPEVNRLAGVARSKGWTVYGVQVNESQATVKSFIQQYNPSFPILMDQQSIAANHYNIKGYPTFVLIDASGKVIYNAHEPPRGF